MLHTFDADDPTSYTLIGTGTITPELGAYSPPNALAMSAGPGNFPQLAKQGGASWLEDVVPGEDMTVQLQTDGDLAAGTVLTVTLDDGVVATAYTLASPLGPGWQLWDIGVFTPQATPVTVTVLTTNNGFRGFWLVDSISLEQGAAVGEVIWSPTPKTKNRAQILANACRFVLRQRSDEALDFAGAALDSAFDKINTYTWKWSLVYQDIAWGDSINPDGTYPSDFPLESDVKETQRLMLLDPDSREVMRLRFLPWTTFIARFPYQRSEGQPSHYSYANIRAFGTISLNYRPSSAWTTLYPSGRLWYYRRIPYLVNPEDAPDVPPEVARYMLWSTCSVLAATFAAGTSKAMFAAKLAKDAWDDIREDSVDSHDWE